MADIVEFWVLGLNEAVDSGTNLIDVLINGLHHLLSLQTAALNFILLIVDIHELPRSCIKVCLHLLQVSALAEQSLADSTALVFEDLLAFDVGTLRTLHKFVAVVFVSCLQVQQGCSHRLDLFFALLVFGVELITIALQFFLLLGGFNNVVDLRVLSDCLCLSCCWFVLLHQTLILNSKILDHLLSVL